ncbi:hypothetical protein D3C80_2162240 [compost metagenome]
MQLIIQSGCRIGKAFADAAVIPLEILRGEIMPLPFPYQTVELVHKTRFIICLPEQAQLLIIFM